MAFLSGNVSFSRLQVVGGAPKRLDENLLEKFRTHRIGSQRVMRSDHEEVGWLGGRHLLDAEFDIEKNVLLDCLHFGMRIDASKIPPDLMKAYFEMEMETLRSSNGNGHQPGRLKRQAKEASMRRANKEIKEGRFRRLRQFPILLDSRTDVLYCGATNPSVLERLYPLYKETFGRNLEPITAGARAYSWADAKGVSRKLENLAPASFVARPDGHGHGEVYWTSSDPSNRDYLGNEFLLWLWYRLSEKSDTIRLADQTEAAVIIVKQLTLECPLAETGKEVITCDGPTQLPESRRAIRSGKLPRKAGLIVNRQGEQYEFSLQAETLSVSSATLPKTDDGTNGNGRDNGRSRAEERIEQVRHLAQTIDLLFETFLEIRISSAWEADLAELKGWLQAG